MELLKIGVQTQNAVSDKNPEEGFSMIKRAGFDCCDFSLNDYLKNSDLYSGVLNKFFDKPIEELQKHFKPHKEAAAANGIKIHQMHMPYPLYVPGGDEKINDYLADQMAKKSMALGAFFECPYIVIHGFKLAKYLGSEEAEWEQTEKFIDKIAPLAKEYSMTICIENLYDGINGHLLEGPCCDAKKAAERIDRINDKYGAEVLGFCFDTGHANLVGIDPEDFIVTLGDRLKVLHIHDNDGISDLHQIPFTFTRTRENTASTDWEGFLNGLYKTGFNKVLSFETGPALKAFPEEMKEKTLTFIADIGRHFANRLAEKSKV